MPISQLCSLQSGGQGSLSREHSQLRKGLKIHPLEETGEVMGARSGESSADGSIQEGSREKATHGPSLLGGKIGDRRRLRGRVFGVQAANFLYNSRFI